MTRTAWRASLEAHSVVLRLLEREMQRDVGISVSWYDVLVHLAEAPGGRLRMRELADRLVLSRSWLTRRIDGMERAGLVHRCAASDDARGVCVELTAEGRKVHRRAARAHLRSVERHFLRHLSREESDTIEASFDRVATAGLRSLDNVN